MNTNSTAYLAALAALCAAEVRNSEISTVIANFRKKDVVPAELVKASDEACRAYYAARTRFEAAYGPVEEVSFLPRLDMLSAELAALASSAG